MRLFVPTCFLLTESQTAGLRLATPKEFVQRWVCRALPRVCLLHSEAQDVVRSAHGMNCEW
jgi:hypothetical protein